MSNAHVPEWTLGDRLVKARHVADLTVDELAAKAHIATTTVWKYEHGVTKRPNLQILAKWADATDVSLAWLVGDGGSSNAGIESPCSSLSNPAQQRLAFAYAA